MPQFQSEYWCTTMQMQMSCAFLCKSNKFSPQIFLSISEHQDSLRNRDKQQLGNGLLPIAFAFGETSYIISRHVNSQFFVGYVSLDGCNGTHSLDVRFGNSKPRICIFILFCMKKQIQPKKGCFV